MKNTKRIYNVIKAILVIALIVWVNKTINIDILQAKIESYGALAPIIYIIAFTILPVFLFPTLSIVIVGGTLFGFLNGLIYTTIGVTTNTTLMYLISNKYAKDKVYNILKDKLPDQYLNLIYTKDQKKLITTFIIFRLVPAVPYIFENYLAGLTEIKFVPFLLTTIVSVIPGTLVYLNVGTSITDVGSKEFISSILILVAFTVLTLVAKKIYDKKHGNNNNSDL
ncbi:TVP38/TMEM64 family protein [Anaerococcus cruorum]|uniref:TVP38/TMEM64 family protein n=1 Tax=Anaerococcus sp. WGS1529 TaxID=3366812 RepID=UPI00372D6BDA